MKEHFQLSVADILKRKHFDDAVVLAGHAGVQRMVKWVHVVEVTSIGKLLNGHELILSTGVAWKDNLELFVALVKELIENHTAGLCIEIGTYMSRIPSEVIAICNEYDFPLIIFQKEVPFVEITQDIHSLIILQQYQIISNFRDLYAEEQRRVEEFEWLHGWLEGDHSHETIQEYLLENGMKGNSSDAVVLITKFTTFKEKTRQEITYLKLVLRSVFEQNGFYVLFVDKRNEITFILLNNRTKKNLKERITRAIESIQDSEFIQKQNAGKLVIAAGKFIHSLTEIYKSYQTAKETLRVQQKMNKKQIYYFYEDLHLYRLISQMSQYTDLQELSEEYLQPVIQYDQKYNGKLLETLKVYLECNGSKQETSNRLFIVRQTLYHRLQKLENLLGEDFMAHEKRVAIEFMLLVHEYVTSSHSRSSSQAL